MSQVQVMAGMLLRSPCAPQDGGKAGHRMSLRMAKSSAPAHRRSLEVPLQAKDARAPQPPAVIAPPDVQLANAHAGLAQRSAFWGSQIWCT